MSDLEHARMLLRMAEKDLRTCQLLSASSASMSEVIGFHAQQAVEKSFKAWLASHGIEYPLTHNLYFLVDRLKELGEDVRKYEDLCTLTPFGVRFRYEEMVLEMESASKAIRQVEDLLRHVGSVIPAHEISPEE